MMVGRLVSSMYTTLIILELHCEILHYIACNRYKKGFIRCVSSHGRHCTRWRSHFYKISGLL